MCKKKYKKKSHRYNTFANLSISQHAIERYKQRGKYTNVSAKKIEERIRNALVDARLVAIKKGESHYINHGYVYVVKTVMHDNCVQNIVTTVMLSKHKQIELWGSNVDHIDKKSIYE